MTQITVDRALLEQALGALELVDEQLAYGRPVDGNKLDTVAAALRSAMLKATAQEPVAWHLDVDECAIYQDGVRVATMDYDNSNDGWRKACSIGQKVVDAMNGLGSTRNVTPDEDAILRAAAVNAGKLIAKGRAEK